MSINKNKLRGTISAIAVAIALIVLMDFCIGGANSWLYRRSKYGIFHRQQYVMNESEDDIIILGSSRASHHYVPSIISDTLGMSCYNAGSEGMCIYYHYAILSSVIERGHLPKVIIYDVMNLDVQDYPGPTFTLDAALDRLAPHYGEYACIDRLFDLKGWKEKLKLHSLTYRYNSKLVQSIKCNFLPLPENQGYEKVAGRLPKDIIFQEEDYDDCAIDSLKLSYVQEMVNLATNNNINLIFVLSPCYKHNPSRAYDIVKDIAKNNHLMFIDCYNAPELMKRDLFRDAMHLNDDGAHVWSAYLANILKDKVCKE